LEKVYGNNVRLAIDKLACFALIRRKSLAGLDAPDADASDAYYIYKWINLSWLKIQPH